MNYDDRPTRRECEADAFKDAIDKECMSDPDYAWRQRVIDAVHVKAASLRQAHEVALILRRVRHLEKWCRDFWRETADAEADERSYRRDPYAYYGLRRSDFI